MKSTPLVMASKMSRIVVAAVVLLGAAMACPERCFCPEKEEAVCANKGFKVIPKDLPKELTYLDMGSNQFAVPTLYASNFSHLPNLRTLILTNTTISLINPGSFSSLKSLEKLDLSYNKIIMVEDKTFAGMNLKKLKLDHNYALYVEENAFAGARVRDLYLSHCNLLRIRTSWLEPSADIMERLHIDNNKLKYLEKAAVTQLSRLKYLNIGNNPWHCSCEMRWFKIFFDENRRLFIQEHPACATPSILENNYFSSLHLPDFNCKSPAIKKLDMKFHDNGAVISCTVESSPVASVWWILPNEKTQMVEPDIFGDEREITLTIKANPENLEIYRCVANNMVGNVPSSISIVWPKAAPVEAIANQPLNDSPSSLTSRDINGGGGGAAAIGGGEEAASGSGILSEPVCIEVVTLVIAVVATLLLSFLIAVLAFCMTRRLRRRLKHKYKNTQERVFLQKVPIDAPEFEYATAGSSSTPKFGSNKFYHHQPPTILHNANSCGTGGVNTFRLHVQQQHLIPDR